LLRPATTQLVLLFLAGAQPERRSSSGMYIEDFNSFYQQAQELVAQQPLRTRYVIKYKHKEGKLVLKVTDDVVVSPQERITTTSMLS
jgi:hypothetical protein